jgi:hypothetical protein
VFSLSVMRARDTPPRAKHRPAWRRAAGTIGMLALVSAFALAGATVAVQGYSGSSHRLSLGTVSASGEIAAPGDGRVSLYVPLVDWGADVRPYRSPIVLHLRVEALDRAEATTLLESGSAAGSDIATARREFPPAVRSALVHVLKVLVLGALAGGLIAVLLVAAATRRPRPTMVAAGWMVVFAVSLGVASGWDVGHYRPAALDNPTLTAHGDELPQLIGFSRQILTSSKEYTRSYREALNGFGRIMTAAAATRHVAAAEAAPIRLVVASDLHQNTLTLGGLHAYVGADPVFWIGDFTELGTRLESAIAPDVARVGQPGKSFAVSGNHDSRQFMMALARRGVVVLTRRGRLAANGSIDGHPVFRAASGLRIAGYDDPLEALTGNGVAGHRLELQGQDFSAQQAAVAAWFAGLPERPNVVMIHQYGLAKGLLTALAADPGPPVLILTGHDHRQHVEPVGRNVLVDGGTVGAGGIFAVGQQQAGFAAVGLDGTFRPVWTELVRFDPLSGDGQAEHHTLPVPETKAREQAAGAPAAATP